MTTLDRVFEPNSEETLAFTGDEALHRTRTADHSSLRFSGSGQPAVRSDFSSR